MNATAIHRRRHDSRNKRSQRSAFPWAALWRIGAALGFSAGVALAFCYGYRWAQVSPQFEVRDVTVFGNQHAVKGELLRLAQLSDGLNILTLDVVQIEKNLQSHPWVKSAVVERRLPSTVRIEIAEHEAVATLALGDLYLVNSDGVPFKRAQAAEAIDLPLITGIGREALSKRNERENTLAEVRRALAVMASYQKDEQSKERPLSEVHLSALGLTLVMQNGLEVCVADGDFSAQWKRLKRVLKELERRKMVAEVIHLENRSRPNRITVQAKAPMESELAQGP
jgi:cell division protein FtsQ